jgi:hypothetical protein
VLLLPDGQSLLQFVDQVSAPFECRAPMARAHADPNRDIPEFKFADPVNAADVLYFESGSGLFLDVLKLRARYSSRAFIEKMEDVPAFVPVSHTADESDEGAGDFVL